MAAAFRSVTTNAVLSVRRESNQHAFSDGSREPLFRMDLNVKQLVHILKYGHMHDYLETIEQRTVKAGKKRTAPIQNVTGPRKRAKTNVKAVSCQMSPETNAERDTVHVYSHVFELGYTRRGEDALTYNNRFANDERADEVGWLQEEADLINILSAKSDGATIPRTFDLGDVTVEEHWGVVQLLHGPRPNPVDDESHSIRHLLTLPTVALSDESKESGDVLYTCCLLQYSGHVSMSASASLVYIPGISAPDLPIQINVTVTVSLIVPDIFSPRVLYVPPNSSTEDRRRRFLLYLFYSSTNIANSREHVIAEEVSVRHFYSILEAAQPIPSPIVNDALQPEALRAVLLPFQRRSVKWLLERESKTIDSNGRIVPKPEDPEILPLFWRRVKSPMASMKGKGKSLELSSVATNWWYHNRLTGSLADDKPTIVDVPGGMLCEEMGLGKTIECIALILLNPAVDRDPAATQWDPTTELEVSKIKTNLIVTPATLSQQWLDEISRHAPTLNVLFYTGYNKVKLPKTNKASEQGTIGSSKSHDAWCSYLHDFDVVVTTYKTLQDELGVAKAPIVRPKRQVASYPHVEKPRSPLVRVEWARVFMDEVQLVGGGKTAEMVSLIPRAVSIAVSGTPARSKLSDLSHVLKFLRVEEAIGSSRTWEHLLKPESQDLFAELFRKYAIRTVKSTIKDELTIPPQRRFAVGIDLGKVEKHIYDEALQEALDDLGVDARGVAASQGWEIDISLLRSWLRRLRQICTHPQVGNLQVGRIGTKIDGGNTIKTIPEVLQALQAKKWQSLIQDRRSKTQLTLRRAQLVQKAYEDLNSHQNARDLLLNAQIEANQLVKDIKAALVAHEESGKKLKEEASARRRERKQLNIEGAPSSKGKGKARDVTVEPSSDGDSDDTDLPRTRAGEEYRSRQRNLQGRLREGYVTQHKVAFLLGDIYHIMGPSYSQAEDASYGAASEIRKSLLKTTDDAATSSIHHLSQSFRNSTGVHKMDLKLTPCQKGGIRSRHLTEEADDVLDLLNEQADLLWQWRARIFALLTQKLTAPDEEQADGEEYTRALDTQGEVEAYLQAYAALLADRKEVLIAERTALAAHEAREIRLRDTLAAQKAGVSMGYNDNENEELDVDMEDIFLQQQLTSERRILRDGRDSRALKAIMFQLSEIGNRAGDRSEENQIAREEGKRLRRIIADQSSIMEKLDLELGAFRKVFNDRIQYFRQLQELSDTVMEVEWEGDVREAIQSAKKEEDTLTMTINRKRAEQRHLDSLEKDQAGGLEQEQDCILCREPFRLGLVTPCAHIFCEPCLMVWLKARHGDCPVCRSKINANTLQRISLDEDTLENQMRKKTGQDHTVALNRSIQFNSLPQEVLDEIQTFEAHGSYGSKITHLIRHLLYLQNQEPGTKSVIFSAWSDSLTIIEQALISNGIQSIRVDQKGKQNAAQRFKADPGILVFLLHGERENAGLNLTCAKRVWLLEPTVNHSFEVQAISRVDRMGQTAATEVFCYYIKETVEENILRMGARRGFSLYTQDHSRDAINISEFSMGTHRPQVDSPSKKAKQKGDFIEKAEDLIHVLFPHLDYREEDLAGLGDDAHGEEGMYVESEIATVSGPSGSAHSNAVAGPSRLH